MSSRRKRQSIMIVKPVNWRLGSKNKGWVDATWRIVGNALDLTRRIRESSKIVHLIAWTRYFIKGTKNLNSWVTLERNKRINGPDLSLQQLVTWIVYGKVQFRMEKVNAWKWVKRKYYHLKRKIDSKFRKSEKVFRKWVTEKTWRYWRIEIRVKVFKTMNKLWCLRFKIWNIKFDRSTNGSKIRKWKRFGFEIIKDWVFRIKERRALGIIETRNW